MSIESFLPASLNTKKALLIIDMQRDFVDPGAPFCVTQAAATVPVIAKLLAFWRSRDDEMVVHIIRAYESDGSNVERCRRDAFLKNPGAVRSTSGAEIVSELQPQPNELVLIKSRFSAFFKTDLDLILRRAGVDELFIAGTQYPNCIRATVMDGLSLDYAVTLFTDCCSAASSAIAEANLTDMRNLGVNCISFSSYLTSLFGS